MKVIQLPILVAYLHPTGPADYDAPQIWAESDTADRDAGTVARSNLQHETVQPTLLAIS